MTDGAILVTVPIIHCQRRWVLIVGLTQPPYPDDAGVHRAQRVMWYEKAPRGLSVPLCVFFDMCKAS